MNLFRRLSLFHIIIILISHFYNCTSKYSVRLFQTFFKFPPLSIYVVRNIKMAYEGDISAHRLIPFTGTILLNNS